MKWRDFGCALAAAGVWLVSGCTPSSAPCCPETPPPPVPSTSPPTLPGAATDLPAAVPAAPPTPGCTLLTPAQVAAALGSAPLAAAPDDHDRACKFSDADGVLVLSIRVVDLPRALLGGPEQVTRLTASPSERIEDIPGLGDAAVFYTDPRKGTGLTLARGRGDRITSIDIAGYGPAKHTTRDVLVVLGFHAAAALPDPRT
ncbi:hypothetical protein [Yinghuangia soli]|uniref:DUF3558 domain-containing protein n=1 Tax=Yinghuangia soli TaxID=2908204 RepID=A0AA41TZL6_9ACTN|nr:hypothetical protein [Yinghuangia soli]MCF2527641.1 hypothetical protein [Yinghuangia soli]